MFVTAVCVWDRQKPREFSFRQAENNNFARDHAFLYICLPSLNEHNVKLPNVTFCRGREQETKTFFFLFLKFDAVL